ncbi:glycosyltransferase family protein [Lachnospiraceae bacterium ZAX-1]
MNYDEMEIAFIVCVNNEDYYEECQYYINRLHVPDGYRIDIISIWDATSIAEAYNEAMESSDAKYKIYLHQDVFIVEPTALIQILQMFKQHPKVGMIGTLGATKIPENGEMYRSWNVGNVLASNGAWVFSNELDIEEHEVWVVDGMFIATQYDLRWRDDILHGWHFYDVSQSFEFRKKGYKVLVPAQEQAWCFHDSGLLNIINYDVEHKNFWDYYENDVSLPPIRRFTYAKSEKKMHRLIMQLKDQLKVLLMAHQVEQAREILGNRYKEAYADTELVVLGNILEIDALEDSDGLVAEQKFLNRHTSWMALLEDYNRLKFLLRRLEFDATQNSEEEAIAQIHRFGISKQAIERMIVYAVYRKEKVRAMLFGNRG